MVEKNIIRSGEYSIFHIHNIIHDTNNKCVFLFFTFYLIKGWMDHGWMDGLTGL